MNVRRRVDCDSDGSNSSILEKNHENTKLRENWVS